MCIVAVANKQFRPRSAHSLISRRVDVDNVVKSFKMEVPSKPLELPIKPAVEVKPEHIGSKMVQDMNKAVSFKMGAVEALKKALEMPNYPELDDEYTNDSDSEDIDSQYSDDDYSSSDEE